MMSMNLKQLIMGALFTMVVMAVLKQVATDQGWDWYPEFFEDGEEEAPLKVQSRPKAAEDTKPFSNIGAPSGVKLPMGECGNASTFLSASLLPEIKQGQEDFSEFAPNADDITNINFLQADRFTTSSGPTRNANLQIRSEPPNPRNVVCAWQQSTISGDSPLRKEFEIGVA